MTKQSVRAPLAALLLRLCVVGLLAAAPALSSRAAVDGSHDDDASSGRWLATRALLQVPSLPAWRSTLSSACIASCSA